MDKRFLAILGVIVLVFGGILFFNNKSSNTGTTKGSTGATNNITGATTSKVTLLEYGDFQCPVCENYFATVQQVQQKYNDTVKFQFRHLPLIQIHPNAFAAARSAEAAANQGKFWEMYDLLYANSNWSEWTGSSNPVPYFNQYAKQLNLDATKFEKDFASSTVNSRINADISAFKATGQSEGTPSFFINGKYYANSNFVDSAGQPSVDAFSKLLDEPLKNSAQ